jgi:DNA mismatch repair protein MutS
MSDAATTPMMKQYLAMRRELPEDVLLFFRLGDFL